MVIRTSQQADQFRMALIPIDQAFWASEQTWGVGRLERLVSPATLAAYQRGWTLYRAALEDGDGAALEVIGPKMIRALEVMAAEAEAAGHKPLAPETWEVALPDGRVLVIVRSQAEASAAVLRASRAADGLAYETTLPPDLAVTVRSQHEGRALVVLTLAEVGRLLTMAEAKAAGVEWEGTTTSGSGRQMDELAAHDLVRQRLPALHATRRRSRVLTRSRLPSGDDPYAGNGDRRHRVRHRLDPSEDLGRWSALEPPLAGSRMAAEQRRQRSRRPP